MNETSFIFREGEFISRAQRVGTDIRLLAKAEDVEVHKQSISEKKTFWLDSADEWQGFEFIYLLQGQLIFLDVKPSITLGPGDYIARHLVPERAHFEAKTDVIVLYISSQPTFHVTSREAKEYFRLAQQIEKDEYTDGHCKRIEFLARSLGGWMDLPPERRDNLGYASFFHDLGKAKVPKEILQKPAKLNDEEWKIMELHTVWGREMLEAKDHLKEAGQIVEQTHERIDGTGYPKGLKGNAISLEAKIISVVDAYDAMTTNRPYRKGMPQEEAVQQLREGSGTQFETGVVESFVEMLEKEGLKLPEFDAEISRLKRHEAFLKIGEDILADKDIQQILNRVVSGIADYTPFQAIALTLYDRPISLDSIKNVGIERVACIGLSPEDEARLKANPLPPEERSKLFDGRFKIGNSYYIPHDDVPWPERPGLVRGEDNTLNPKSSWHPDDYLCIPMMIKGQVLGIISVDEPSDRQAPTAETLEPVEIFANFAALAIERTRHLQELQESLREREWLNNFLHGLNQVECLEDLLELIIKRGIELLSPKADAGALLLWNEKLNVLEFQAAVNRDIDVLKQFTFTEDELNRDVLAADAPLILTRTQQLNNQTLKKISTTTGALPPSSSIMVPIRKDNHLLVLLNINNLDEEGVFNESDAQKLWVLVPEIELALSRMRDREKLLMQAIIDPLTQVYNRHYLSTMIEKEQARAKRYNFPISLIMLDFIDFYEVNDRFGHLEGDRILFEGAAVFKESVRTCDAVIRYGGDEFLIVLPETNRIEAERACHRLESGLKAKDWKLPFDMEIRTGVATWEPRTSRSFEDVIEEADAWMHHHKRKSKIKQNLA